MKADAYIGNVKKVIPIYHATKNRKLKGDVDSQLANANVQQELLAKRRRKLSQGSNGLSTYTYSVEAIETFGAEVPAFDCKA